MKKIVDSKECYLCNCCLNFCKKDAIEVNIQEDFFYRVPNINTKKCVNCNLCIDNCIVKNEKFIFKKPLKNVIGVTKDNEILKKTSSGGIFSELAKAVLSKDGIVFGATMNDECEVKIISIDNIENLYKLYGSKYVQSDNGKSYIYAKEKLNQGKIVLYTGLPCQIAGLYNFLGKEYENLITIDLVCHGVPSYDFFKSYKNYFEEKNECKIKKIEFRSKKYGWGHKGEIEYISRGKKYNQAIDSYTNSYYYFFSRGIFCKESCYSCKFAQYNRIADITLGDFWGIEKYKPQNKYMNGVSCILINTENGNKLFNSIKEKCIYEEVSEQIACYNNGQLRKPIEKNDSRDELLEKYKENGYKYLEMEFQKINRWKIRRYINPKIVYWCKKILKG